MGLLRLRYTLVMSAEYPSLLLPSGPVILVGGLWLLGWEGREGRIDGCCVSLDLDCVLRLIWTYRRGCCFFFVYLT